MFKKFLFTSGVGSLPFFSDDEEDSGDSSSQDDDSKAGDSADNDADVTGLLDEQLERRNNAGWLIVGLHVLCGFLLVLFVCCC